MKASTRRYIYGVATAAVPLAIALGYVTENLAPSILAFVGSVLGFGLATANTPSDE